MTKIGVLLGFIDKGDESTQSDLAESDQTMGLMGSGENQLGLTGSDLGLVLIGSVLEPGYVQAPVPCQPKSLFALKT